MEQDSNTTLSKLLQNTDLFATGGDESESEGECTRLGPPSGSLPPPATRTKKKNAARGPRKDEKKPSRLKKAEINHMYSEGQRLVRESAVRLPEYQPKTKTLDGFLTKLKSRHNPSPSSASTHTVRVPPAYLAAHAASSTDDILRKTVQNKENNPPALQTQPTPSLPPTSSPPSPPPSVSSSVNTPTEEDGVDVADDKSEPSTGSHDEYVRDDEIGEVEDEELTQVKGSEVAPHSEPSSEPRDVVDMKEGEDVCVDESISNKVGTQSVVVEDQTKEERRAKSPTLPPPAPQKQRSLASLFAKQLKKTAQSQQAPTATMSTSNTEQLTQSRTVLLNIPSSLPPAPKLSSVEDFILNEANDLAGSVVEGRELTPLERFQQKLMQQMTPSQPPNEREKGGGRVSVVMVEGGEEEVGEEEGGKMGESEVTPKPLISDDVILKLKDKPGAIREVWRSELRRQMSQRLAEERQAVEETKRFYNEEIPDDVEEAEFTDPDTSDHEFIQNEAEEDGGESEACSDLDEQEGVEATGVGNNDETSHQVEEGDMVEGTVESEAEPDHEEEMDGYSAGEESDGGGYFSDIEGVPTTFGRSLKKQRLLDSDDEDETSAERGGSSSSPPPLEKNRLAVPVKTRVALRQAAMRRPSVLGEEASMGALVLNGSFENEDENTNTVLHTSTNKGDIDCSKGVTQSLTSQTSALFGLPTEMVSELTGDASASIHVPLLSSAGGGEKLPADSGVGGSLEEEDVVEEEGHDMADINQREEDDEEEEDKDGPTQAVPDSDKDNSLESSLLWALSLAPAQAWSESVDTATCVIDAGRDGESPSQWQGTAEYNQRMLDTQNASIDEETQFLDANGLLHLHKQKRQHRPLKSTAFLGEPSLDGEAASTELLALCSGKFETQSESLPPHPLRSRHPSDSNSVQGVRELLGLQQPRPAGISNLLGSTSFVSEDAEKSTPGSADMTEVLGLCSGAFPTTQTQTQNNADPTFTKFGANVRNGHTLGDDSDSDSEEERGRGGGGEGELLSWARRQKKLTAMLARGGNREEDEDIMPTLTRKRKRVRPKATKGERLAEFVESEAELSGEDVGSGLEEEEEGEGLSEYEEDEGAQSDLPLSESELWNQVNKAHMKETMADDRADLRDLKERFLQEGDLYEDGLALRNGFFRSRRFMAQSEGSLDLFAEEHHVDSGGEERADEGGVDESSQIEAKRRKDRLEREEFIRKCREHGAPDLLGLDEDSQSILNIIRDTTSHSLISTPSVNSSRCEFPTAQRTASSTSSRCGSFLHHNSATLRRLSSITSATPNVTSGKSFVFQKASDTTPRSSHHADVPLKKVKSSFRPPVKRPKVGRTHSTPHGSVFSLF